MNPDGSGAHRLTQRRASGVVAQLGARSLTHPTRQEIKDMRRTAAIVVLTLAGALAGAGSAAA